MKLPFYVVVEHGKIRPLRSFEDRTTAIASAHELALSHPNVIFFVCEVVVDLGFKIEAPAKLYHHEIEEAVSSWTATEKKDEEGEDEEILY